MKGKVLSFEEALQQQKQAQSQHEEECQHCKFLSTTTNIFLKNVQGLNTSSDAFTFEVEALIEYVQDVARFEAFKDAGMSLIDAARDIGDRYNSDEDDDDERCYDDECGDCGCECGYDE